MIGAFLQEVVNHGKLKRANDIMEKDFVEPDPFPGQEQGREGLKATIHQMCTAFPDIHWTVNEMVVELD